MPPLSERLQNVGSMNIKPTPPGQQPVAHPPTLPPTRTQAPSAGFQRSPIPPIGWSQPNVSRWEKNGVIPQHRAYTAMPALQSFPGNNSTTTVVAPTPPASATVGMSANPTSVASGGSVTLNVTATNASSVTVSGTGLSSQSLPSTGGSLTVSPPGGAGAVATYSVSASAAKRGGKSASASVAVRIT